ncbi:MAG: hypothetical protein BM556_06570 [Bacteriovorax sp. MedPE-SWde]|nr:MAG: hypothetical protein BM556_06570 [Bacteriovorax sp. MedPE-SWde]
MMNLSYLKTFVLSLTVLVNVSVFSNTEKKIIDTWNEKIFNMHDPLLYNGFFGDIQKTAAMEVHKDDLIIQLYSSFTKVFQSLEGLTWREEAFLAQSDFVYSMWVSSMRSMYAPDYQTSKHMRKFGRYLTEPNMKKGQFAKISDFQDHLLNEVKPRLIDLSKVLEKLSVKGRKEFIADQYVYRGYIPAEHTPDKKEWFFVEERDRYQKVLPAHFGLLRSQIESYIGMINFFGAYNFNDIHKFVEAIVNKATVNAILKKVLFRDFPSPLAIVDRMEELKKDKYKHLFTLRNGEVSKRLLMSSLKNFSKSINIEFESYKSLVQNVGPGQNYIVDTDQLKVRKSRKIEVYKEKVAIFKAALDKKSYRLKARATRYEFDILPHKLFEISDFKKLLPKEYFEGKEQNRIWKVDKKDAVHPIEEGKVYAWDFNYGKPVKYMDSTFNGFIPKATDKNYLQLIKSLRLSKSTANLIKVLPIH